MQRTHGHRSWLANALIVSAIFVAATAYGQQPTPKELQERAIALKSFRCHIEKKVTRSSRKGGEVVFREPTIETATLSYRAPLEVRYRFKSSFVNKEHLITKGLWYRIDLKTKAVRLRDLARFSKEVNATDAIMAVLPYLGIPTAIFLADNPDNMRVTEVKEEQGVKLYVLHRINDDGERDANWKAIVDERGFPRLIRTVSMGPQINEWVFSKIEIDPNYAPFDFTFDPALRRKLRDDTTDTIWAHRATAARRGAKSGSALPVHWRPIVGDDPFTLQARQAGRQLSRETATTTTPYIIAKIVKKMATRPHTANMSIQRDQGIPVIMATLHYKNPTSWSIRLLYPSLQYNRHNIPRQTLLIRKGTGLYRMPIITTRKGAPTHTVPITNIEPLAWIQFANSPERPLTTAMSNFPEGMEWKIVGTERIRKESTLHWRGTFTSNKAYNIACKTVLARTQGSSLLGMPKIVDGRCLAILPVTVDLWLDDRGRSMIACAYTLFDGEVQDGTLAPGKVVRVDYLKYRGVAPRRAKLKLPKGTPAISYGKRDRRPVGIGQLHRAPSSRPSTTQTPTTRTSTTTRPPTTRPPTTRPPTTRPPTTRPPTTRPTTTRPTTTRPTTTRPTTTRPPTTRPPTTRPPTTRPTTTRPTTTRPPTTRPTTTRPTTTRPTTTRPTTMRPPTTRPPATRAPTTRPPRRSSGHPLVLAAKAFEKAGPFQARFIMWRWIHNTRQSKGILYYHDATHYRIEYENQGLGRDDKVELHPIRRMRKIKHIIIRNGDTLWHEMRDPLAPVIVERLTPGWLKREYAAGNILMDERCPLPIQLIKYAKFVIPTTRSTKKGLLVQTFSFDDAAFRSRYPKVKGAWLANVRLHMKTEIQLQTDPKTGFPMHFHAKYEPASHSAWYGFSDVTYDAKLPPSLFAYSPPRGARISSNPGEPRHAGSNSTR
jgi:outer membrane lipoprotein-sorting protein